MVSGRRRHSRHGEVQVNLMPDKDQRIESTRRPHVGALAGLAPTAVLVLALLTAGCATLPPLEARAPSAAIPTSSDEALGRVARASLPADVDSGFRPIPLSAFSMDARLTLARRAQKTLDLQYYLLQNDVTGHTLLRAVRDAALRGVRVRILVDDLYTASSDQMLLDLAAYPNLEIRLFNPFPAGRGSTLTRWMLSANEFSRVNHRMHNKMFIADGAFAIAGGRNIADEYFFSSKEGNFIDFDLLLAGAAVPRMAAIFDKYWNSPRVYPLHAIEDANADPEVLRNDFERISADAVTAYPTPPPDTPDLLGWYPVSADMQKPSLKLLYGHVEVFADDPEKVSGRSEAGTDTTTVTYRALDAIGAAKFEVTIGSPYFIPGKNGLERMQSIRERGVAINVVTNSLASNDEPFASAAYGSYRVRMLQMGANLYELNPAELKNDALIGSALHSTIGRSHSKLIIIDHNLTFVGSMNMDLRSSRLNTEFGMLVESPELAGEVLGLATKVLSAGTFKLRLAEPGDHLQWVATENGKEKVYDDEPEVPISTQMQIFLLFPFVSESLL
jgi:cardiolipin synthase C